MAVIALEDIGMADMEVAAELIGRTSTGLFR
jgi:hypothetical protein